MASSRAEQATVRSIAAPAVTFVSPPAVRRAVAGYAAEQGWAPNLTAAAVRESMAVALSAAGLSVQTPGTPTVGPWARAVPTSFDALQTLTGLDRAGVRSALEVLASAGVLRSAHDDGGLTLTFSDDACWAPHRLLASAPWSLLSLALARANAPIRAALVVFAELASDTEVSLRADTIVGDEFGASVGIPNVWLELTLKELAHRVGYHLSHVENALAGLEVAACLTRLRGTNGRALRLAAWTVGADAPPAALLAAPRERDRSNDDDKQVRSSGLSTGQIMVEFQGVRAVMAPGDTLDVSGRDADGRRVLRIRTEDGDVMIRSLDRGRTDC